MGEEGGINLYGYVGNNPLTRLDPLGLWAVGRPIPSYTTESTIMTDGRGGIAIYYGTEPLQRIPVIKTSITIHEGIHRLDAYNENNSIGNDLPAGIRIDASSTAQAAISEIDATKAQMAYLDMVLSDPSKYNLSARDIDDIKGYERGLQRYLLDNYGRLKKCPIN